MLVGHSSLRLSAGLADGPLVHLYTTELCELCTLSDSALQPTYCILLLCVRSTPSAFTPDTVLEETRMYDCTCCLGCKGKAFAELRLYGSFRLFRAGIIESYKRVGVAAVLALIFEA